MNIESARKEVNKVMHNLPIQLTDFIGREMETKLVKDPMFKKRKPEQ